MTGKQPVAVAEYVEQKIFLVRGQQIMLGMHLAEMYEVEPGALDQVVERNIACFPEGAVFRLNPDEIAGLAAQATVSNQAEPYAFTGAGMAMLASILLDENAISGGEDLCPPTCGCHK